MNNFRDMTLEDVEAKIRSNELSHTDLTFALEEFGYRCEDGGRVRELIVPFLSHEKAYVREGALYGLNTHVDDALARQLEDLRDEDSSAAVRSVASEMFRDYVADKIAAERGTPS